MELLKYVYFMLCPNIFLSLKILEDAVCKHQNKKLRYFYSKVDINIFAFPEGLWEKDDRIQVFSY